MKTEQSRMPFAAKLFLAAQIVVGVVSISIAESNSGTSPAVGSEFPMEGFQKAKIIGISNDRAIVVLTNNAGQNSYEEMSFNTVEMLKSLPQPK